MEDQVPQMSPGDISDLLWSVATLGIVLEARWLTLLLHQSLAVMEGFTRDQLADVVWSLASLGYKPVKSWLDVFAATTLRLDLALFSAASLSKMVWALASFQYMPPTEWLKEYVMEAVYHADYSPQGAAAVLWSLAVFQVMPEPLWMKTFYSLTGTQLSAVPPDGLVNVIWAIAAADVSRKPGTPEAKHSLRPGQAWMREWMEEIHQHWEELTPTGLVKVTWALAVMDVNVADVLDRPSDALLMGLGMEEGAEQLPVTSGVSAAEWMDGLANTCKSTFGQGAYEPLEVIYLMKSWSQVWDCQEKNQPAAVAVVIQELSEQLAMLKVPPSWIRLDLRAPPYALPT